jgi:hypothetical protein
VDGLVLFGGIFAGVLEDDFGAAGVLGHEFCDIVGWEGDSVSGCKAIGVLRSRAIGGCWTHLCREQ